MQSALYSYLSASAALSAVMLVVIGFAGIYWMVSAKNWFTGPRVQGSAEELAAIERDLTAGELG